MQNNKQTELSTWLLQSLVSWKHTKDVNCYNIFTTLCYHDTFMVLTSLRAKVKLAAHCLTCYNPESGG